MRRPIYLAAALALVSLFAGAASADPGSTPPSPPNMQTVLDSIRGQRDAALDELAVEKGRSAAQQAAYEARLATAMAWLKTAQDEAAAAGSRHAR